ncbi:MAG: FHA domain-containing protein [Herbaspirillum sp.]
MASEKKVASITLVLGETELQRLPLNKERVMIGRRPHNDMVVDHPTVSSEHAVIVTLSNDSFLEDLNSTNGTLVNGQPIKKHFLQDGDVIELAKYRIHYRAGTRTTSAAGAPRFSATLMPQLVSDHQHASLQILNGSGAGREMILNKPLTTLGLPGVQVAVILDRAEGYAISHLEGTSRPQVNGKTIGFVPEPLQNGDVLNLAGTEMRFLLGD